MHTLHLAGKAMMFVNSGVNWRYGVKVAFSGSIMSGKSTVCRLLADRGFYLMDYTGYLKELAADELAQETGQSIDRDYLDKHKQEFREYLQKFGTRFGSQHGHGIADVASKWMVSERNANIAYDNIRYERQFEVLSNIIPGFVHVGLRLSEHEQKERARRKGVFPEELEHIKQHMAEQPVPAEIYIDASRPAHEIANIFLRFAGLPEYR